MTILIIEDNESVRTLLKELVKHAARELGSGIRGQGLGEKTSSSTNPQFLNPKPSSSTPDPVLLEADNLDSAVALMYLHAPNPESQIPNPGSISGILCDGTFPAFPNDKISFDSSLNSPRILWYQALGHAKKLGIPFVLLTGQASEIEYARRRAQIEAFGKPGGERAAVARICDLAIPKSLNRPIAQCLDDPRFTNGRLRGCINPNDERGTMSDEELSAPRQVDVATTEGEPLGDSTGEP